MVNEYRRTAGEMAEDTRDKWIIDIRAREDFLRGSAVGAENIYWGTLEAHFPVLPKDKPIYLLCYTGETSDEFAQLLNPLGYEVYSITEGYRGYMRWKLTNK